MKGVFALVMGIAATVWLGYESSWDAAAAVFLMIWANNLSRPRSSY